MSVNPVYVPYGKVLIDRNSLAGEPVLNDGNYTATLKNGVILKFSNDCDTEFDGVSGQISMGQNGETIVQNGRLIDIQGSERDDNIQLYNSYECNVYVDGGGNDKVKLSNEEGYGFNWVTQDDSDATYIKEPSKEKKLFFGLITWKSEGGYKKVTGNDLFVDYEYNRPYGL